MPSWSEDEVLQIVSQIVDDSPFTERDDEYATRRDLLFQRRQVVIPGIKNLNMQFRSPEIEDDAHAFKNRMLAAPVTINVASRTRSEGAQRKAQNLENFFYRLYHRWRELGVFDGALFDQASVGLGATHLLLNNDLLPLVPDYDGSDPDAYLDEADEVVKEFTSGEKPDLFVLEHTDTATLYWSPDWRIRIQAADVPLAPLAEMYAKRGKKLTMREGQLEVTTADPGENIESGYSNWNQSTTLYTVETDEYCYHIVYSGDQGEVLGCYRNYFGTPAFFTCPGEATGSGHPLYGFRPLVNGKYQTVPIKNVLTTALMTAGVEGAQQRYALEWTGEGNPPEDETNLAVQVNDDGVVVPPPGYRLVNSGLMAGPDLPRALEAIEAIDKYGYPKALNRPEEVTASSGYDRARQQDAVASLLDPPLSHFSSMLTQIFQAAAHAVKEIGLPITVRSIKPIPGESNATQGKDITITPDDVIEADISVSFNSITVFSRIAMQEEGLKMMQADQMTETDFQSKIVGTDDVEAWREQRALDKVLKAADDRAVRDALAAIDAIAASTTQFAMQQNGVAPATPPVPTMPNMVETNGQQLRSDRGASIPIGPGAAMPAAPTPPNAAELGMP